MWSEGKEQEYTRFVSVTSLAVQEEFCFVNRIPASRATSGITSMFKIDVGVT